MAIIVIDKLPPSCVLLVHLPRHIKILLHLDPPPLQKKDAAMPNLRL